jgi:hypothetical protein
MRQLGQWRIERDFVTAEVILVIDATGLHHGELPGAQPRHTMLLVVDHQLHRRGNHPLDVTQKLAPHLLRKRDQGGTLSRIRRFIDD